MKNLIDILQNNQEFTLAVQIDESSAEPVWDYKLVGEDKKDLRLIYGDVDVGLPGPDEAVTAGELGDYLSGEIEPDVNIKIFSEKTDEEYTAVKVYKKQKLLLFYIK